MLRMMLFSISEADDLIQKRNLLTRIEAMTFQLQVHKLTSYIPVTFIGKMWTMIEIMLATLKILLCFSFRRYHHNYVMPIMLIMNYFPFAAGLDCEQSLFFFRLLTGRSSHINEMKISVDLRRGVIVPFSEGLQLLNLYMEDFLATQVQPQDFFFSASYFPSLLITQTLQCRLK